MSSHHHNSNNNTSERIPMLMKSTPNDILLTTSSTVAKNEKFSPPHKFYDMRPLTAKLSSGSSNGSGSTNGIIINNYGINNKNSFMTRICCHMMKGVQRNIQKCVAALVLISFFSIIFFTQYMDSSSPLVG